MLYSSRFFLILVGLIVVGGGNQAFSQSITLTSPVASQTVREGDDYFTSQLSNPADFTQRRDMGWEENYNDSSISVSNGIWSGTNSGQGAYSFPLFPGFKGSLITERNQSDTNLPSLGITKPIDASNYTTLCYRSNHSSRSTFAIYWANDTSKPTYWPDGTNFAASNDAFYPFPWLPPIKYSGFNIYCYNMTDLSVFEQKGGSWSGNIFALRLDPSIGAGAGAVAQYDWVRLVNPSSSSNITVNWTASGLSSDSLVSLYVQNLDTGDETPLKIFVNSNPGTYTFNAAILPPGRYRFFLTAQRAGSGVMIGSPIRSNLSGTLTINPAPIVSFTSPSATSGSDYFADVGNAADMNSLDDIKNYDPVKIPQTLRQWTQGEIVDDPSATDGKIFRALADRPLPGNLESDNQVWLPVSTTTPIDPFKYCYLEYRIAADPTLYPTIADKVRNGWVTRFDYWRTQFITDDADTGAGVLYEGWNTYMINLCTLTPERGKLWRRFNVLRNIRIDMLETVEPTLFYIDYVKLHAENRSINNAFNIQFNVSDADASQIVQLYYDTDKSGFNGTLIATLPGLTPGSHSYTWNTSSLTNGSKYYIYAVVSDGVNTSRMYAPEHVIIGEYQVTAHPELRATDYDFDGDGVADEFVYRSGVQYTKKTKARVRGRTRTVTTTVNTPSVFYLNESSEGTSSLTWGTSREKPVTGDFDGDGKADLGLVTNLGISGQPLLWYVVYSSTGATYYRRLGTGDDQAISGDFNGNYIDEIGVFNAGAWTILDETDNQYTVYWGTAGDIPVPADYDGDAKDDIAVYRPSEGKWYFLNSSFATGGTPEYSSSVQYGLDGDIPVPADFDGDGKADFAVFRPATGMWYIKSASGETQRQFGLSGDIPKPADRNGDGLADISLWRPGTGTWYTFFNESSILSRQWGLYGDLLNQNR